ncbi:conserved hypothetical protein [Histoplasma capsulatum var. duboisii H88]|uniref:Uncharacterized protein n=1 Tax=Ajellomyces capsulatus (strain H88) TaxID=544711 RepID=F0UQS4_AJEC8|nr:conserved hypothetical protein [Histoplasma capsulatum var. duboisii H88]
MIHKKEVIKNSEVQRMTKIKQNVDDMEVLERMRPKWNKIIRELKRYCQDHVARRAEGPVRDRNNAAAAGAAGPCNGAEVDYSAALPSQRTQSQHPQKSCAVT